MNKQGVAPLSARDAGSGSSHVETDAANSGAPRSVAARSWPWLAAALSGCLLYLAFPPWNFAWLAWIALVPLICAVWFSSGSERTRRWRALFLGYLTGIIFFAAIFSWLGTLGELFEQPWLHTLPIILSFYLGLYFAFWAWFIALIPWWPQSGINEPLPAKPRDARSLNLSPFCSSSGNLLIAFLGASAWVAQEWVRGWLFSGFGWNGLGVALHRNLPMIQIVDLAGVAALSFLLVFCNLMFVIIAARLRAELGPTFFKRVRWEFSLSMVIVVAVLAYGVAALRRPPPVTKSVRIAAVQPNVPQHEKFSVSSEDRIFERLNTLTTLAASTAPDLIVWPESATHRGMYSDETNYQFVRAQAARGDFGFLLGTVDSDFANGQEFNVALLLTDRGETVQSYRKMHLVPFGEYLPLRKSFPLFAMIAGELVAADFSAGTEFTVLELPQAGIRLAALICFEDTLGDLTRHFVANGAQLLVNLTNDGWFLTSPAVEQHLANAIFRAVETRRPLVRCGNTGVTCAIDRFGRIDRWLPPFQRGFFARDIDVPVNAPQTFYTRWGEWFAITAAIITVVALARLSYLKRRSRCGKNLTDPG